MRLDDYLSERGISDQRFANAIGCHVMTVYRIRTGVSFPKKSTLLAIVKETDGRVSANDFINLERAPERRGSPGRPRKVRAED